jgi:hypothetical protein
MKIQKETIELQLLHILNNSFFIKFSNKRFSKTQIKKILLSDRLKHIFLFD